MATILGVERTDPHQPMHSALTLQVTERVLAADGEGRTLDPGFLPLQALQKLRLEAALLGPAQIHPQQHLRPVLRLGSTGSRVDRHQGIVSILGAGELQFELELGQARSHLLEKIRNLLGLLALGDQLQPYGHLFGVLVELIESLQVAFQTAALLQQGRTLGRIVPEVRGLHLLVDFRQLLAQAPFVKGTPGDYRSAG
jgi:hypothetical protein